MAGDNKSKSTSTNNTNTIKGNKRKQRYRPHNKAVKKKGGYPLRPGVQGFFITCDGGRERQASNEAINVIDSFYEELVSGKDTGMMPAGLPNNPLNKKITFSYSDDDDDDDDDEEEEEEEEEEKDEETKEEANKSDTSRGNANHESLTKNKLEQIEEKTDDGKEDGKNQEKQANEAKEPPAKKVEKDEEKKEDNKSDICTDNANHESPTNNKLDQIEEMTDDGKEDGKDHENQANEAEERPAKKQCIETGASKCEMNDKVEEKSIDKLIEAELKELGDKNKRRFINLDSGCNGVVVVQMRKRDGDPGPKDIVQHMMTSAASTRKHMSRFILRVLPVEVACYASEEEISRAIKPLVEQYFPVVTQNPQKFAVLYEARANTGIDRMKIINSVAKSVPGPHKVDLSNPDKTIVVEIVKTVCLIGVVDKYKELAKFNLRQLTSPK